MSFIFFLRTPLSFLCSLEFSLFYFLVSDLCILLIYKSVSLYRSLLVSIFLFCRFSELHKFLVVWVLLLLTASIVSRLVLLLYKLCKLFCLAKILFWRPASLRSLQLYCKIISFFLTETVYNAFCMLLCC